MGTLRAGRKGAIPVRDVPTCIADLNCLNPTANKHFDLQTCISLHNRATIEPCFVFKNIIAFNY